MKLSTNNTSQGGARKGFSKKFADIPASAFLFDSENAEYAASIALFDGKGRVAQKVDDLQFALAKNNAPDSPPQPKPVEILPEKQATRADIELLRARLEAAEIKHEAVKAALYDELCAQELEDVTKIIKEMNG